MTAIGERASTAAAPTELRWGLAWRRPPAQILSAAVAAAALARYGVTPEGITTALFVAVLVLIAVIDFEKRIIPNAIVVPAAVVVLAMRIASEPDHALEFVLAAVGAAACLFVLHLINRGGMGMGDVKLGFLLGAGLGAQVVPAVVIGSLAVWPLAFYLLIRDGTDVRKATIAFGPYLAFGAIVVSLVGGA
jgi:prepilin signal peptidase PulO-like enzyme (type II secretory pathway)